MLVVSGESTLDVVHHTQNLWKVTQQLEFDGRIVNMDFSGDFLAVLLQTRGGDGHAPQRVMTFRIDNK